MNRVALSIIVLSICVVAGWILISMKLNFVIDMGTVRYKFFPNEPKWSLVSKDDIIDFGIAKRNIFSPLGHHRH